MKRKVLMTSLFLLAFSFTVFSSTVPTTIQYRGYLLENNLPVNGLKTVTISFYDLISAGALLWNSGAMSVNCTNGNYVVSLGPIPSNVFTNANLFLNVNIQGLNLAPRERIVSAPYALSSDMVDNLSAGKTGKNYVIYNGSDGRVGIGTNNPQQLVHIRGQIRSETNVVTVKGADMFLIPSGCIALWSGTLATIPQGWILCDGTSGTPDLRDKFVESVVSAENPGVTGGVNSYTMSVLQMPSHLHTGNTDPAGNHSGHTPLGGNDGGYGAWTVGDAFNGNHGHSGTTGNAGLGQAIDNRPRFYKLAYIMKK